MSLFCRETLKYGICRECRKNLKILLKEEFNLDKIRLRGSLPCATLCYPVHIYEAHIELFKSKERTDGQSLPHPPPWWTCLSDNFKWTSSLTHYYHSKRQNFFAAITFVSYITWRYLDFLFTYLSADTQSAILL